MVIFLKIIDPYLDSVLHIFFTHGSSKAQKKGFGLLLTENNAHTWQLLPLCLCWAGGVLHSPVPVLCAVCLVNKQCATTWRSQWHSLLPDPCLGKAVGSPGEVFDLFNSVLSLFSILFLWVVEVGALAGDAVVHSNDFSGHHDSIIKRLTFHVLAAGVGERRGPGV